MGLSAFFTRLIFVVALASICIQDSNSDTSKCGCPVPSSMNMLGPRRGRRSPVPQSPQLLPSRMWTLGSQEPGTQVPRAEFEQAASPSTGVSSDPPILYINCLRPWPGGILRYRFERAYPESSKNKIRQVLTDLQFKTDNLVQFLEIKSFVNEAHVTIKNWKYCWSPNLGMKNSTGSQDMYLSVKLCMKRYVILYWFMRALGFDYEHKRPDRDKYLKINWNKIGKSRCSNFNKEHVLIPSDYPGYDYESIMHYPSNIFSCKYGQKTLLTKKGSSIKYYGKLSRLDIKKLKYVYSPKNLKHCLTTAEPKTASTTGINNDNNKSTSKGIKINNNINISYNININYIKNNTNSNVHVTKKRSMSSTGMRN